MNKAASRAPEQAVKGSQLARGILQRKCACGQHTIGGGECAGCSNNRPTLQRATRDSELGTTDSLGVPPVVYEALRSPGQPLDAASRAFFEPRFGHDFSHVRVHTDAKAAESAQAVNAVAYTVGRHVVLGAGQYAPQSNAYKRLFAHELTHVIQQRHGVTDALLTVIENSENEREADAAADGVLSHSATPTMKQLSPRSVSRQKRGPDESPQIERSLELDPGLFIKRMDASAPKEIEKCEEFPGGSTDCEVDAKTGNPTGKVTHRIDETNPCTKPCVEEHEAVHVKQLKTFCVQLRDCYLASEKEKRPVEDCFKMVIFGLKERECAAYKVSVPCLEKRLKTAKACQSKENTEYGTRELASEKCFREKNCGG